MSEIRALSIDSDSLVDRLQSFRLERLGLIDAGSTPMPLEPGAKLILHGAPFSSFEPGFRIEMPDIGDVNSMMQPIKSVGGWSWRQNFDGLLWFSGSSAETSSTYTQLFRNGAVEAVDCRLLREWDGEHFISGDDFEKELLGAVKRYKELIEFVGLLPPTAWMLTLSGVKGYQVAVGPGRSLGVRIDRDVLMIPEVLQEQIECRVEEIVRPLVDPVWQASGFERSINFDSTGAWKPQ